MIDFLNFIATLWSEISQSPWTWMIGSGLAIIGYIHPWSTKVAGTTVVSAAHINDLQNKKLDAFDAGAYASFAAAVAAIGATPARLWVTASQSVAADVTVPATLELCFTRGGELAIATTKTVTINGEIQAGLFKIFNCTGSGKAVFGSGAVDKVYPQWFTGADAGIQIQAALDSLPAEGGIVDGRGYSGTQTISVMVTVGSSTRPAELLLSQAATFVPASVGLTMFWVKARGRLDGLRTDGSGLAYTGNHILLDDEYINGQLTQISNIYIQGSHTADNGIAFIASAVGASVMAFVSIKHVRISGCYYGILLNTPDVLNCINSNHFEDIQIENAHTAIAMIGLGQNNANLFSNISIQYGGSCVDGIDIEQGDDNLFLNLAIWDWPNPLNASKHEIIIATGAFRNLFLGRMYLRNVSNAESSNTKIIDNVNSKLVTTAWGALLPGHIPYYVSHDAGMADSGLHWDGTTLTIGTTTIDATTLNRILPFIQDALEPLIVGKSGATILAGLYGVRDTAGTTEGLALQVYKSGVGLIEVARILNNGAIIAGATAAAATERLSVIGTATAAGIYMNDQAPNTTTNTLYRSGNDLYWGATKLN